MCERVMCDGWVCGPRVGCTAGARRAPAPNHTAASAASAAAPTISVAGGASSVD